MDATNGSRIATCANSIADWLGVRDVSDMNRLALEREAGLRGGVADLFVLFGGGVLGAVDVLAHAMKRGVARRYAIVGGRGHATYGLARSVKPLFAEVERRGMRMSDPNVASEAEMLSAVLRLRHGLAPDFVETHSTNCGNNIAYLLDILDGEHEVPQSVVLCQDATMQRRMDATWKRQVADRPQYADVRVVNWALYRVRLAWDGGELVYENAPEGMWDIERYLSLLLGDVARLTDDENGYGPCGAGFVVHVDVPREVQDAWRELRVLLPDAQRM